MSGTSIVTADGLDASRLCFPTLYGSSYLQGAEKVQQEVSNPHPSSHTQPNSQGKGLLAQQEDPLNPKLSQETMY